VNLVADFMDKWIDRTRRANCEAVLFDQTTHRMQLKTLNMQLFPKSRAGDRGPFLVFGNGENGAKLRATSEVDRLMVGQFRV
jgi:hypothetical protein